MKTKAPAPAPLLTPRDTQMLALMVSGISSKAIGERMGYSNGTIRVYLHNLYKKIGVRSRSEATAWLARQNGASAAAPEEFSREDRAIIATALYVAAEHWTSIYIALRKRGTDAMREDAKSKLASAKRMRVIADDIRSRLGNRLK